MKPKGVVLIDVNELKATGMTPEEFEKQWSEYDAQPQYFFELHNINAKFIPDRNKPNKTLS